MSVAVLAAAPAAGGPPVGPPVSEEEEKVFSHVGGEEEVLVHHGAAEQTKKGEDFWIARCDLERAPGRTFHVYGIFDGHNGHQASLYSKEHLLHFVLNAIPSGLNRDDWLASLPRALVIGFLKADTEFNLVGKPTRQLSGLHWWPLVNEAPSALPLLPCSGAPLRGVAKPSVLFSCSERRAGTTATLVVVEGNTVTVAAVGDSRCILDTPGGAPVALTVDHRLESNQEEVQRIVQSGGEIGRLETPEGIEVGPMRVWPGGLCLSRSIGDKDVGDYIVPVPHVKQIRLPPQGGRLIVASDGVWDAVSNERAAKSCRGMAPQQGATQIIKEALRSRGLRDDTTCLVIDVMPVQDMATPMQAQKKKGSALKRMFTSSKKRAASTGDLQQLQGMQEIFEATGADFYERLGHGMETSVHAGGSILCSICKTDLTPGGVSVHAGSIFAAGPVPWQGPFICARCKRDSANALGGGEGSQRGPLRSVSVGSMLAETIQEELAAADGGPDSETGRTAHMEQENGSKPGQQHSQAAEGSGSGHTLNSIGERSRDR